MGADGNLIRAAGEMGPKAWDYSGIIKAIDAIGKYTAHKRAVASELTSYGDQNINVDSIPEGLLNGTYGDQNMDFMINQKTKWKDATKTIGKLFPGSKKYKNAIKTINNIKKTLERNKADATIWNNIWNKRSDYFTNMSKGTPFLVEDRFLDLAMDGSTNNLSSNLAYTDSGIVVATPQYAQDIDGNEVIDVVSIKDFLNGYEENLVTEDVSKKINNIIDKYGKKSIDSNEPEFLKEEAHQEFTALFTSIKNNKKTRGFAGIRSLAYDYQWDGESYVEANSQYITNMTNEEWVEKVSELRRQTSIDRNDYVLLPTADEIAVMKEQVSAWAFDANNQAELEANMMDWFMGIAEDKFNSRKLKPKLGDEKKIKIRDQHYDRSQFTGSGGIIEKIKAGEPFNMPGTKIKIKKENGKWMINKKVTGEKYVNGYSNIKDGTNADLHNYFGVGNDPDFQFLLTSKTETKIKNNANSTEVLPIHSPDTIN